jgi:hypothetical protein
MGASSGAMVESFRHFATGTAQGLDVGDGGREHAFSRLFGGMLKERGILFEDEMHHGPDASQRPVADSRVV